MKFSINQCKSWLDELTNNPGKIYNRRIRFIRFVVQLWRFSWRRLQELNARAMASALSFRTLFAMIPLLVLSLMIMSALGVVEDSKESLRDFLDSSGIGQITVTSADAAPTEVEADDTGTASASEGPATDESQAKDIATDKDQKANVRQYHVADEIEKVVSTIQSKMTTNAVGAIGIIIMISAAIALLVDVEKSLNRIFEARFNRGFGKRMMLYWSVVTLLPIVQSAAVLIGSRTQSILLANEHVGSFVSRMTVVFPIIGGIVIVSLIYWLMPNTRTRYSWALFGAVFVVPVWFVSKWLFGLYVSNLVGPNNLYGNIGLLPLLLLWVNTSWMMFLFGAVLAHIGANISVMESSDLAASIHLGPLDILATTMAIAGPFARNEGPVGFKTLRNNLHLPDDCIQSIIDRLVERRIICPVDNEQLSEPAWLPARPLESISLLDVTGLNPDNSLVLRDINDSQLKTELTNICNITKKSMENLTLAQATEKMVKPL
ncbi:MAG: YihY/virulence factor BrkB family protein [Sedimentisphaerales bacterium]|nr:YihY/virulence factor BrkB family protein [Sedimentisphaerales bacterium]MBN2843149.1 YihY/virulence factor BrkB family protein [Sedimentisphaerales bacterium]